MADSSVDLAGLSPEEKRALLTRLLMQRAESSAAAYPLSYGQQALWFLYQLAPDSPAYSIMYAARIRGPLDVPALERAVGELVDRHASLRTTYTIRDGRPVQLVHPRLPVPLARRDGRGWDNGQVEQWLRREADRPVDLRTGPALRVELLAREAEHILLLVVHHIAVDFWSLDVLLDELRRLYAGERLAPPAEQYVDYVGWQAKLLAGEEGERLWRYWREQLAGELPILRLPTDRPRPAVVTHRGSVHRFELDRALTGQLRQAATQHGVTLYLMLLAGFVALLHRYSDQDDIVVGTPMAGRDRAGLEAVVGYLANPVVLRADLTGDPSFAQLLGRVRERVLGALAHQDFPFGLLVERLQPPRDPSRSPVFQVSFAWEQTRRFGEAAALPLETIALAQGGAPLDLMLQMSEVDGVLAGAVQFNTDLFDPGTITRLAGHFETLLRGATADPSRRLWQLPLRTEAERRQQERWHATGVDYQSSGRLHELVAAQVGRTPDAVAVVFRDQELSYAELDARAELVAVALRRRGVRADVVVPVLVERCAELVVALLGVLKAGGAFMPMEPANPPARLAALLDDMVGVPVVLTQRRLLDRLPPGPALGVGAVLCLDDLHSLDDSDELAGAEATRVGLDEPTPASIAYVIHTSGSTGRPKGALNTHEAICNRLLWMQAEYRLTATDRVLHKTPVSFDVFVWEVFWPLIAGARVVVAEPDGHRNSGYLVRTVVERSITVMHFVPSLFRAFLAEPGVSACQSLRQVFCSGEALPVELQRSFHNQLNGKLHNLYGPTEAAIDVTYHHCRRDAAGSSVPIGHPIANIRIHLLDGHLQPVPVGVPGELYLAGVGIARGYLGRPGLTAAAFMPDPFAPRPGERMYRTGDLARYRPDGSIDYLGRRDHQVKINGVRIEPQELEAVLGSHPAVRECVVVARDDGVRDGKLLTAYVVPTDGNAPSTAQLRHFLLQRLPAAMVPAVFVSLEAIPLTPSGKVDRRALPRPAALAAGGEAGHVAPRTPTEELLVEIWRQVLHRERVGVHDDFFALGGASTQSLEVMLRANAMGLALVPESVFQYGTIAELAAVYGPAAANSAQNPTQDQTQDQTQNPTAEPTADQAAVPTREPTPAPATVEQPAATANTVHTVIESLGVYLPERVVSTQTVLDGCVRDVGMPLEKLTGIKHRPVAGEGEFSIDLAERAAAQCLARSSYDAEEIDLVIACNISRCDGPAHRFTFEPSTAVRLRQRCGLTHALAFDLTNACAGMFTGIVVAEAFLATSQARRALVVSGEYITHLTDTAQREIEDFMDTRLACLTLGDAGAAVILERAPSSRVGFHDIDMCTLARYSTLCVAKATDRPHGGAIMFTDAVRQTAIAVKRAVPYVASVLQRNGWRPEHCDHLIMHQTSESSLHDSVQAINHLYGAVVAHRGNTVYNLAERGNTASTTHFVAINDLIAQDRLKSGDSVVFGITGSGQTVGAALYTFDDLPDRLREPPSHRPRRSAPHNQAHRPATTGPRVRVDGVATATQPRPSQWRCVGLASQAAADCLDRAGLDRRELGLLIHAGVYRDEFLSEPAVAALVAGELGINDDLESPDDARTLAFDVSNGGVGWLNACHAAVGLLAAGRGRHAMVIAAEVENNAGDSGGPPRGVSETGSALLLSLTETGTAGFGRFVFGHRPEHGAALHTYTVSREAEGGAAATVLQVEQAPDLAQLYLDSIPAAVAELLALDGLSPDQVDLVLPPQLPPPFVAELRARLNLKRATFVDVGAPGVDHFTSSLPVGLQQAYQQKLIKPGSIGLMISVGSGLQVGCATYYF